VEEKPHTSDNKYHYSTFSPSQSYKFINITRGQAMHLVVFTWQCLLTLSSVASASLSQCLLSVGKRKMNLNHFLITLGALPATYMHCSTLLAHLAFLPVKQLSVVLFSYYHTVKVFRPTWAYMQTRVKVEVMCVCAGGGEEGQQSTS